MNFQSFLFEAVEINCCLSRLAGVVLAESTAFVTNPIGSTFSATQPVTTVVQTHPQGTSTGAPTLVSSPRPSILRKKPVNEG